MPYEVEYDSKNNCIVSRMTGKINQELIIGLLNELLPLFEKYNCKRIINDLREADPNFSTVDLYSIPRLIKESGRNPAIRRAVVMNTISKDLSFFETVSLNRGQLVKGFTDFNEALKWVKSE